MFHNYSFFYILRSSSRGQYAFEQKGKGLKGLIVRSVARHQVIITNHDLKLDRRKSQQEPELKIIDFGENRN